MVKVDLCYIPLITGIIFPGTFLITYIIGTSNGNIRPLFSYISDTGAYAPESCVFTFLLWLSAVAMTYTIWLRYKQVDEYLRESDATWPKRLNCIALVIGVGAGTGVALVASFQENRVYEMHFLGAVLAFFGGGIYLGFEAYFTFKMLPLFASRLIAWARVFASFLVIALFIICFSTGIKSVDLYTGSDATRFEPGKGGWDYHVISVVTEWVMFAVLDVYLISFAPEFRKISREPPKYQLVEVTTQVLNNNNANKVVVMHRLEQHIETTIA